VPLSHSGRLEAAGSYTNFHFYYQACMAVSLQSGGVKEMRVSPCFFVFWSRNNFSRTPPLGVPRVMQPGHQQSEMCSEHSAKWRFQACLPFQRPEVCSDESRLLIAEPSAVLTASRIARAQHQLGASHCLATALTEGDKTISVTLNSATFWDVTPCDLVGFRWRFARTYFLNLHGPEANKKVKLSL
jgi:hypothetical protein